MNLHDHLAKGAEDSADMRAIRRAIAKAGGHCPTAERNVCRLYVVKSLDRLPPHIQRVVRGLLPPG